MPDALNIQPFTPVGRGLAAGTESAGTAAAAARGSDRRISANSFKLLTAKLKNGPVVLRVQASQATSPTMAPAAGIAQIAEYLANAIGDFSPGSIPQPLPAEFGEISTVALSASEPAVDGLVNGGAVTRLIASELDVVESANHVTLPTFVPLPQFTPVEWPNQNPAPGIQPLEVATEPDVAADTDILAEPIAEPEAAPEIETLPELVAAIELDEILETVDVAELVEIIEPVEIFEPVEIVAPVVIPEHAKSAEPDALITAEVQSPPTDEQPVQIEDQPESIEVHSEVSAVSANELDNDLGEEAKTAPSEMAVRVVDAMIKTISTAIYAKPSAAERAAFLRDVATLAKEAEEAGVPVPPPYMDTAATATVKPSPVISVTPSAPGQSDISVTEVIAERLGAAPLLKSSASAQHNDPFTQSSLPARLADPKPTETVDADDESGDLALTLLDMMSGGTGSLPHERTLAADTLLRILPRIPVKQLMSVVERVAIMETPPALLVAKLIRDPRPEVVGPLLERCSQITDQDLMNAAPDGDTAKLRMVARRRVMSTVLSDFLIAIGDPGVLLTLIRNPGAALSHDAFFKLAEFATGHHALLAPLATRGDLPPPVAFELFWHVPQELRRFIFSRFLTDSETLNKILRITLATHGNDGGDAMGEGKFPARDTLESAIALAAEFKRDEAAWAFADMGGIAPETAARILADQEGEPLTVLLKALGLSRAGFEDAIGRLRLGDNGLLRPDRNPDELQAIFEGLSFNKARILLTYWDWYTRKAGPYAPHN